MSVFKDMRVPLTQHFFLFNLNLFAYTETSQLTANLLPLLVETDIRMCFARK